MSLETLINEAKNKKENNISVTVRLSEELNSIIEDLAENQLSTSKQKTLVALIEQGVKYVEESFRINEMSLDEPKREKVSHHLLNTNKGNDKKDGQRMYEEGIAAAFYDDWKKEIEKINKNDIVYLYENGVGIIAYGIAEGKTIKTDKNGDKDEMYYQHLKEFKRLKEPFKASQIKDILAHNIVFLKTRTTMKEGEKLLTKLNTMQTI